MQIVGQGVMNRSTIQYGIMVRIVVVLLLVHRCVVLILIAIALALVNRIAMNALAQMWVTVVILIH